MASTAQWTLALLLVLHTWGQHAGAQRVTLPVCGGACGGDSSSETTLLRQRVAELQAGQAQLQAGQAQLQAALALLQAGQTKSGGRPCPEPSNNNEANMPQDCKDILDNDATSPSGVYMVYPRDNLGGFLVFCDMDTDGGGWTLFQRRQNGTVHVDFYRNWTDYRIGFPSNLNGEFWLGNDNLYRLAVQKVYQLRVDLEDVEGNTAYATYDSFALSSESHNYRLYLGAYHGTAGNSMSAHNGGQFSTKDRDNDDYSTSCAQRFKGAWWYSECHTSNLNGLYHLGNHESYADGVNWLHWKGYYYSLKRTEMKIRPTS